MSQFLSNIQLHVSIFYYNPIDFNQFLIKKIKNGPNPSKMVEIQKQYQFNPLFKSILTIL